MRESLENQERRPTVTLHYRHLGQLMNYAIDVRVNGFTVRGLPYETDARDFAANLCAALDCPQPIEIQDRWTAALPETETPISRTPEDY